MATKPQLAGGSLPQGKRTAFPPKSGLPRAGQTQAPPETDEAALIEHALAHSRSWSPAGHGLRWESLLRKYRAARMTLQLIYRPERARADVSNELLPSRLMLHGAILEVEDSLRRENYAPQVEEAGEKVPRAYLAAKSYLAATSAEFNDSSFIRYMQAIQEVSALQISEIWLLSPLLQLQLLLELCTEIEKAPSEITPEIRERLRSICASLARLRRADWLSLFETISVTEKILAKDPAAAYS